MQNLNHLLHFDPDHPEPLLPALERVADDEIIFASDLSVREEVRARAWTVATLMEHGMQVDSDEHDANIALDIMQDRATITNHKEKPAVMLHLEALLSEYDYEIVHEAARVRRYVTNKLIEESGRETNKASERIKALELLGKISDVGMFVERSVVTIEHKSTEELQQELESTLELLFNPDTDTYEMEKPIEVSIKDIPIGL